MKTPGAFRTDAIPTGRVGEKRYPDGEAIA